MKITSELFEAFLKCPTKCLLLATSAPASGNIYADWIKSENKSYQTTVAERLFQMTSANEPAVSLSREGLETAQWHAATGLVVQAQINSCLLESAINAVERVPSKLRGNPTRFIPVRFIFANNLGKDEKLLLAFDAFVLSKTLRREVGLGKIIHGDDLVSHKVKTSALVSEVQRHVDNMVALLSSASLPDVVLNRHCTECEFQTRCRKMAVEKDDLSLLGGMSAKERKKLRSKGIFTITQLSYTFRPRRRPKWQRDKTEKYHHSLKALAIREKKIHIVGDPEFKIEGTPVYLDIEGLPDRDFYYLIGIRIRQGESSSQHSLWAETIADEGKIWREFLAILQTVEKPVLIHYGSYETDFLKRMQKRHGGPIDNSVPAGKAVLPAVNLLSAIFARVYFPTYSNGLKEIAGYLGFHWSDATVVGAQTIGRRREWEETRTPFLKESLIKYNINDCEAVEVVANKLVELHRASVEAENSLPNEVVDIAKMKREHPYGFKRNTFALPELNAINNAAYWDYQRDRVYVKSNPNLKTPLARPPKTKKMLRPNKTVECRRPRICPKCASARVVKHTKYSKIVYDIKFMQHGIKRWITCYRFHRYLCQDCGAVFQPKQTCWGKSKFGREIIAYALHLGIELRLPQLHVAANLNRLFGFNLSSADISHFKAVAAKQYKWTYNKLVSRLCSGRLLHSDETKANVRNKDGFVWVFANMEEVAYVYSETRDGDMLRSMLKNYNGVLVSDFYAAYDSIQCPQQKCLIHLIRDLNDDLLKHPYDEELKQLASAFAVLLRSIVETVDRHGLKSRFLKKHIIAVNRFYREIAPNVQSETAVKFVDRLQKNRDKLFVFLKFDGVPWNNNNAEHAVKPFAMLRRVIGGVTTEKGLRDYLVILSICQTCKYMGVDFLNFLRSGKKDIHTFADSRRQRQHNRHEASKDFQP